ncbi:hypothetical protein GBF38_005707 [Nibea albiflora]|uniref:Uncharacterized protein n=1 Tax=Nibea albiflora TaxID=240163 RepID=A0ACB7F9H9_NIBAL|nr:hypothetical protein GBF38_005707 [Nibea albiflora]
MDRLEDGRRRSGQSDARQREQGGKPRLFAPSMPLCRCRAASRGGRRRVPVEKVPLSSPLPSLKVALGGAGGDTIVSGRLSVSSDNNKLQQGHWQELEEDDSGHLMIQQGGDREGRQRLSTINDESLAFVSQRLTVGMKAIPG